MGDVRPQRLRVGTITPFVRACLAESFVIADHEVDILVETRWALDGPLPTSGPRWLGRARGFTIEGDDVYAECYLTTPIPEGHCLSTEIDAGWNPSGSTATPIAVVAHLVASPYA